MSNEEKKRTPVAETTGIVASIDANVARRLERTGIIVGALADLTQSEREMVLSAVESLLGPGPSDDEEPG